MVKLIVACIMVAALIITVFLGVFTMFCCRSAKRGYFIVLDTAVFLFALGYLLEVTAGNTSAGFTALKVMYLGAAFIAPLYLLFVSDYCESTWNRPAVIALLLVVPVAVVVLLWTTNLHGLIYTAYQYNVVAPVPYLEVTPGRLYYINHFYSLLCMALACLILAGRLGSWHQKYRSQLVLLLVGALMPVTADILFVLKVDTLGINYTPLSLAVLNVFFYINIMRYDLFDIIPQGSAIALDVVGEAFILVDGDMGFLSANPAAYGIFPQLQVLAKGSDVTLINDWPEELSRHCLSAQTREANFRLKPAEEQIRHYNTTLNGLYNPKGKLKGWVILIRDITDTVMLLDRLEEVAHTDGLTGLFNRRYFQELAERHDAMVKRKWSPYCLILFDLDHFKRVNDTYGHEAGDQVLKVISARIKKALRSYDLLARYGGEEFIILAADTGEKAAVYLAERLRQCIEGQPVVYQDTAIAVTASFGVAAGRHERGFEATIRYADQAMYQAKGQGRNRTVLYKEGFEE